MAIVFIKAKKKANYVWVLTILQKALRKNPLLEVILTYSKLVMINTIHEIFSTSFFFFRYYINRNIGKACRKYFTPYKVLIKFYSA